MAGVRRSALVVAALLTLCAPALAQAPLPAKPQVVSLDSDAPPGSPPHWLPGDKWVTEHWLPYDEARLYELLEATRGDVWRWLRDDTRNLAGLAQEKGWDPQELARELVAPWKGRLREPGRLSVLEDRALKTLTQGHLAQHVFFHSLHQNSVPDNAPAIFGTASRDQFQALRRAELSPIQICRLNGLSRSHAEKQAEATLRANVAKAVNGQAMTAAQGKRLLARQLRQLPRWLHQTRYNGPPPIKSPRASASTASNYSNNGVISADGTRVAFESYDSKLAQAKQRGEISVLGRRLDRSPYVVSRARGSVPRAPRSSYNPAISADGRVVAFESSEGNLNFAKRYGKMGVFVRDIARGETLLAGPPPALDGSARSAYNPTISADGRLVAYESYGDRDLEIVVTDARAQTHRRVVPSVRGLGAMTEPRLSGQGHHLVFTAAPRAGGPSKVFRHDLRTGRTVVAGEGAEDAFEGALSETGRFVAYTQLEGGRSKVLLRDLRSGKAVLVDGLAEGASASEPAISADGRYVAFTARDASSSAVYVFDAVERRTELVSRADGAAGPPAAGNAAHPSIAADGRRIAFTSDAWNLSEAKCNSARGIFIRDLDARTTKLVSVGDGQNRFLGPTKGSSTAADMTVTLVCA